jgi:hypothetical protein
METALLTKVLVGAGILFFIGYIGNLISFSNRFMNALVTAIVFAIIYGALFYFIDRTTLPPELQNVSQQTLFQMVGLSAFLVFVIDLIANMLSFSSRFMNALMTAIVFAVLYGALLYFMGNAPVPPTAA